ncbi:MAG: hypothetical protein DWQ02_04420 [Bacteroidetes bacterium]|nr:MAG: hypothetical protein DWQ02_04420 [Bacteroidota bacterium]
MKFKYLIPVLGLLFLFSCNKDLDSLSEADLIALEGMQEAYEKALEYNELLVQCEDPSMGCDSLTIAQYDELYHEFDSMFDFHHENYSHENGFDDHRHEGGSMINMNNNCCDHMDEHGYDHNMETNEWMEELRLMHEPVHPE